MQLVRYKSLLKPVPGIMGKRKILIIQSMNEGRF